MEGGGECVGGRGNGENLSFTSSPCKVDSEGAMVDGDTIERSLYDPIAFGCKVKVWPECPLVEVELRS